MKKWIILILIAVLLTGYGFLAVRWYNYVPQETEPTQASSPSATVGGGQNTPVMATQPEETLPPAVMPEDYALTAKHAFVYDCSTNELLFTLGDQNDTICPASITKLLTAYTALQYLDPDTVTTAGDEVTWVDPDSSLATVEAEDALTVEQLVEGMMLQSGNDAAYTLCVTLGRHLMNDPALDAKTALSAGMEAINLQARLLGMEHTYFVTPDGDDEPGHSTTPADMLTLGLTVMEQPLIMHYAGVREDSVTFKSGKYLEWKNTNMLLHQESGYYCSEAVGLKTGYTSLAGACQLSLFHTGGRYLLIGVFGCPTYWDRAADSLYLYEQYR